MFLFEHNTNSSENIRTDIKVGILPIPIVYWLRFRIFKPNQENPDEIGMVGQSGN